MASSGSEPSSLILVSGRGPVAFRRNDSGALVAKRSGGGLVTALGALAQERRVTWIAHAMGEGDIDAMAEANGSIEETTRNGSRYDLILTGVKDSHWNLYYNVMSNPLLWFTMHRLHGFSYEPVINRASWDAWRSWKKVNERIAAKTVEVERNFATKGSGAAPVMVHDYQLMLVPGMVRRKSPETTMQWFCHVPWPGPGAWRCLPGEWLTEILESILSCDLVGFQTPTDVHNFMDTCRRVLPGSLVQESSGEIQWKARNVRVRAYPISVDAAEFNEHASSREVARMRQRVAEMRPPGGKLIVRVDRTDPSKNLIRGFQAFNLMLRERRELHGQVSMFCQFDPSRQDIPEYSTYLERVNRVVDQINETWGTNDWTPVRTNVDSNFAAAVAAYLEYDVLFVNPVADGMNLVCKEGVLVNQNDGVLVLSEQAGAARELGKWAELVNPFDVSKQADTLYKALMMPEESRKKNADLLRQHVLQNDISKWLSGQLQDIGIGR